MTSTNHRIRTINLFRLSAVAVAATLVVTACGGGGGGDDSADTTSSEVSEQTTTTAADVTTTAPASTTTAAGTTTTTIPADPVMPLTGMPITDQAIASRAALVVKLDNHPQARPQFGLNAADIVYEENVEKLTRFAAVYQSQDAEKVGPIRSGRTQDVALLGSLNKPLFAWSGGNGNVTTAIRASDLIDLSPTTAGPAFYRNKRGNETSEHTLYSGTPALFALTPVYSPPPVQQFTYLDEGEAFNGDATDGVNLKMDGVVVDWFWDAASKSYLRFQGGREHFDATMGQVNAANVVAFEVDYQPSPADARSPEAQTVGTGRVWVFTGGVMVEGTWTRTDRLEPFTLTDNDGEVIALTPGRTWVELARVDTVTPLPAE